MAQPVPYVPAVTFQAEETAAVAGRSTVRTSAVDAELQAVSLTLSQILTNLAVIQRDDTGLRDLVVTTESLSANVKALFAGGVNPRGAWLTATSYAVKDVVETLTPLISYICVVAHTSGVFATDRAAGKWMVLGSEPGVVTLTSLTLTTGGITLVTNNTQDLAATGNRFRDGWFGRTVTAGTSVVTPLVGAAAGSTLGLQANGGTKWIVDDAPAVIYPSVTGTSDLGSATLAKIIRNVFAQTIDSGTIGSLSIRTGNGSTHLVIDHVVGVLVNAWHLSGAATGNTPILGLAGGDANQSSIIQGSKGAGTLKFQNSTDNATQFEILNVAGANRWATITGSNGGNPTIGVTAGNLAITPAVVIAGAFLSVGAAPLPGTGAIRFPYANGVVGRESADGFDIRLIDLSTVNTRNNIVRVGDSGQNTRGVQIKAFTSGVPSTADLAAGWWAFYEDTGGATFKLYYNAAGTMKSVALT